MGKKATYKCFIYEGNKKREAIPVKCDFCGIIFLKAKRFVKENGKNFCCKEHSQKGHKVEKIKLKCDYCGNTFYKNKSSLKGSKSGLYFCEKECKDKAQRIESGLTEIWPPHYNGSCNYRKIALKHYPNSCEICGYNKHIKMLQIHHIDSDRENNDIENLMVLCPNCHWSLTMKIAILEDRKLIWIDE